MWAVAQALIAPISVSVGYGLSRLIDDETRMYDLWFLFASLLFSLIAVFYAHMLWLAILCLVFGAYALKTLQGWLLGMTTGLMLFAVQTIGSYLVAVSLLPACAYFVHHEQPKRLWLVALLPTLISVIFFLL